MIALVIARTPSGLRGPRWTSAAATAIASADDRRRRVAHLLVGGGIASVSAAQTLREEGAEGSVAIVSRELDLPYHRPPCSKGYLQGSESREDTLLHPPEWYAEHDIELLTRTGVVARPRRAHGQAVHEG